jgi:hypothetical protein
MRAGQIIVTYEQIAKAIGLPSGNKVTAAVPQSGRDVASGTLRLIVVGDDMPKYVEGQEPMIVTDFREVAYVLGEGSTEFFRTKSAT